LLLGWHSNFNINNFFGQGRWCLFVFLPIFNSHLLTGVYVYLCSEVQPLFFKQILAMLCVINATSIKTELVANERPNEVEAYENDEGNEDPYNDIDENNFFNSKQNCTTCRSIMISLSNTWSYMLIYEGQTLSHVKFHFPCSNLKGMIWRSYHQIPVI
jgi:hypothetical protein